MWEAIIRIFFSWSLRTLEGTGCSIDNTKVATFVALVTVVSVWGSWVTKREREREKEKSGFDEVYLKRKLCTNK